MHIFFTVVFFTIHYIHIHFFYPLGFIIEVETQLLVFFRSVGFTNFFHIAFVNENKNTGYFEIFYCAHSNGSNVSIP